MNRRNFSVDSVVAMAGLVSLGLNPWASATVVPPRKRKSIVEQIRDVFRRRGYDISEDTAQLCWRMHAHDLDIQDSEPFPPLPRPDEVFRIVVAKEKIARLSGVKTHLVKLP